MSRIFFFILLRSLSLLNIEVNKTAVTNINEINNYIVTLSPVKTRQD